MPTSVRTYGGRELLNRVATVLAMTTLDVDYLVVGAGAMGMAFTDALIGDADVRVALVDRRHGVGGPWPAAYPFARLHPPSTFYGAASPVPGRPLQAWRPEAGLHERAGQ